MRRAMHPTRTFLRSTTPAAKCGSRVFVRRKRENASIISSRRGLKARRRCAKPSRVSAKLAKRSFLGLRGRVFSPAQEKKWTARSFRGSTEIPRREIRFGASEKKKTHRRFDSRNRPRRFPAPRSRVLTVRFAQMAAGMGVIHAKSREKHAFRDRPPGSRERAFVTPDDAPLRDAVVSGKSNEHEPRDAQSARRGGVPPARDAPRGREHDEARARGARRNHPDPCAGRQCGAPGCDVQDARAVRRGGGEDGHHARRRRRVPPLASAGTRASKFPARASRETRPTRRLYRTRNIPLSTKTATRDVAKNSQRSRGRRARTRREARGASRREPRDVLREPRRPAVPRGAAMRPRARTARAARRHRIGRIRPFPVRERRGEVPVGLGVEATVSAGCRGHFSR